MFVSGGVGAGLSLLRGEVLELAAGAVDQRAGEEQREDPPLERVGQVRAERGVRGGQRGGTVGGGFLRGQLAERSGDDLGVLEAHQPGGLAGVDRMGLPGRRLAVQHHLGGAQPHGGRELALGDGRGIRGLGGAAVRRHPAAHHEQRRALVGAEGHQLPEADGALELPVAHVQHAARLGAVAAAEGHGRPLPGGGQRRLHVVDHLVEGDGGGVVVGADHFGGVPAVLVAAELPHAEHHADRGEHEDGDQAQEGVSAEQDPAAGGAARHP